MMRNFWVLIAVVLLSSSIFSAGNASRIKHNKASVGLNAVSSGNISTPSELPKPILTKTIDDFEDGTIEENPKWWTFGNIQLDTQNEGGDKPPFFNGTYLQLGGATKGWFVGGIGTFLGLDGTRFSHLKLLIRGYGPESGSLIFELYDDDNNNWKIEPHPQKPSMPAFDDKFSYSLKVTWEGWKLVSIPLNQFYDSNPKFGDDIWNPNQKGNSGGLIQMQILLLGARKSSKAAIDIDSIQLVNDPNPKPMDDILRYSL